MTALLTIGQVLSSHARLRPNAEGARDLDNSLSYAQWNERACRLANALTVMGLEQGQRVAILAYNRLEWVEIYAALAEPDRQVICATGDGAFGIRGRVVGTTLGDSDYAAMARAFGAHGERVEDPADLPAAIRRALDNAPAVVDVVTSQDAVSSDATKGLGYVPDYQALTAWDEAEQKRRVGS